MVGFKATVISKTAQPSVLRTSRMQQNDREKQSLNSDSVEPVQTTDPPLGFSFLLIKGDWSLWGCLRKEI